MGSYIYKVSSKPCMFHEGKPVFEATYGYKPYWSGTRSDEKANAEMAFRAGVVSCVRWWKKKPREERDNVLIKQYNQVFLVPYCDGAVLDDWVFDRTPVLTLEGENK